MYETTIKQADVTSTDDAAATPTIRNGAADPSTADLAGASPVPERLLIPLSKLRASGRNVRAMPSQGIAALAENIDRIGLLQNLSVIRVGNGSRYEVVAGSRRHAALRLLVKKHRLARDWPVPCLLVGPDAARTASLSENLHHETMHPADEFAAFAALVAEGRPIEDIAADFGVTPLVVQRRLRLANVSPRLMADYRVDAVSLEQLMALAITDDFAAQEAAYYDAPEWQRSAASLKARLTEREVRSDAPIARFVGRDAYVSAGGTLRRDLFDEEDGAGYFSDSTLLERLALARLEAQAEAVRAEGWAWVDCVPQLVFADRHRLMPAPCERRQPKAAEARRLAALDARIAALDKAIDEALASQHAAGPDEVAASARQCPAEGDPDGDSADSVEGEARLDALHEERDAVLDARQTIEESLLHHAPHVMAVAGAVLTIDREGKAVTLRGQLREDAARTLRAQARREAARVGDHGEVEGDEDGDASAVRPADMAAAGISNRLTQRLSAQRTAALQIELARHPHVALAAVVQVLAQRCLHSGHGRSDLPLGVIPTFRGDLAEIDPDVPSSPAVLALREARASFAATLPTENGPLFTALLDRTQDELVQLLALCIAPTLDAVVDRASARQPGASLARAVALDMACWWQPTAASYFGHLSKASILSATRDFAPAEVGRLATLRKADLAREAERLVVGTGWMPAVFGATRLPKDC